VPFPDSLVLAVQMFQAANRVLAGHS
jgi:hypothetical protein